MCDTCVQVPAETRRGLLKLELQVFVSHQARVLGTGPEPSATVACALNC